MTTRTKFQGWENPQSFQEWEAEQEQDRREASERLYQRERRPIKIRWSAVALWGSILAFTGFFYGFAWAYLGPVIHKVLARVGLWP